MFNAREEFNKFVNEYLNKYLVEDGFKLVGKNTFKRKRKGYTEEIPVHYRRIDSIEGRIEIFIAMKFNEIQKSVSELQCDARLKNFMTVSNNIGFFMDEGHYLDFKLNENVDLEELASKIIDIIRTRAKPFWENYTSIESIIRSYELNDPYFKYFRHGRQYMYDLAVAYLYIGEKEKAIDLLNNLNENFIEKDVILNSIQKLEK